MDGALGPGSSRARTLIALLPFAVLLLTIEKR